MIQELSPLLDQLHVSVALDLPLSSFLFLSQGRKRCNSINRQHWNQHFNNLHIQSKFKDIVDLKDNHHAWKKIMQHGLPSGELSFLF